MKFLLYPAIVVGVALAPARAEDSAAPAAKSKGGPVQWLWQHIPVPKFGGKKKSDSTWNDLRLELVFNPPTVKLPDTRRVEVTLQLTNGGKKLVQLEFPTSQRIDVLIKDSGGRVIERWSEDQVINSEPTVVTLNPGERLEYTAAVATRDMTAGQRYVVEGFFPRYPELRVVKSITPQ